MSAILLDAAGNEVEQRAVIPQRVHLPRAALDRLAELTGVPSPAGQVLSSRSSRRGMAERVGGPARDLDSDPEAVLEAAGLIGSGVPTEAGRAVLAVWHAPTLAVELEMVVALRRGTARVRSWHRNLDEWVVCLSTADGHAFELGRLCVDDWWLELGRAVHVDPRGLRPAPDVEPVPDVVETPWELLLATGEAVRRRRHELLDQLVSDRAGTTLAGGSPASLGVADDRDVRRWHEQLESTCRGRLHAAVIGRSERGRGGAGLVEWVLHHDGWRSLTPFARDGWTMVRIERRGPTDLARTLACLAAGVTS